MRQPITNSHILGAPKEKDTIIIPCSDSKSGENGVAAFDLYTGSLMSIVRQFDNQYFSDMFNLLFLSARYGLISSTTIIDDYNQRISNKLELQQQFSQQHSKSAQKLLRGLASKSNKCYVVLSKDYAATLSLMHLPALKAFGMVYHSTKARGIGDHRSRLKKIINSSLNPLPFNPTYFRSGCSNPNEFVGYIGAGQSVGTSLHYAKRKGVMQYIIDAVKSNTPCFVDNGLISAFNRGIPLDVDSVFTQYIDLVKGIKGSTKALSIVIPDAPHDESEALATITKYKKEIKWLARRCDVIIPFHRPINRTVVEQAQLVASVLGKTPFTIGVPCRKVTGANWRMDISDIESLFELKINGTRWVNRIHYFALSEVTKGDVYQSRLNLARVHGIECQLDCTRTTAFFGSNSGNRVGSVAAREVEKEISEDNAKQSIEYLSYDDDTEWDETRVVDHINELTPSEKATLWNKCFPYCAMDTGDSDEDLEEVFDNLFCSYFRDFISKAKKYIIESFVKPSHVPSYDEKRSAAIIKIYTEKKEPIVPVQLAIGF